MLAPSSSHPILPPSANADSPPRGAWRWGLALLAGCALGGWVALEIVYHFIGTLIAVYSDFQMQLGVYNLYDHLLLYRLGFAAMTLLLLPLAILTLFKR